MTRPAHPREREIGIDYYVSETDGIGGRIRDRDRDFRVEELERFDVRSVDENPSTFPHLVLRVTLSGWDTNAFAARLSDALGMSRERVSWAGTKDKRAVTTQLVSVRGAEPEDLPAIENAQLEVVGRAGRELRFGDLAGNRFEIVVRDADRPELVGLITDELRAFGGESGSNGSDDGMLVGVPNYFGQQRFGSLRAVTHVVGLCIVRGDWEGAVLSYVGNPRDAEPEGTREARRFVEETRDWRAALDVVPRRLGFERAMLHRLAESGGRSGRDFRDALDAVPSNVQRLFVNAAQSYVFNRILSERFDRGLAFDRAVEGDVVCFADRDTPDGLTLPDVARDQRATGDRLDAVNRHVSRGRAFVTAPLVGTETDLADGEQGRIERDVLAELDLDRADFDLPEPYHSSGTRRAILVRSDLDVDPDPLTFGFALPSGSYATVLLREYLKADPIGLG